MGDSELDELAAVAESGVGMPELVRVASRALDASLAVSDAAGSTLAVAAASPADERVLLAAEDGGRIDLYAGGLRVGELRRRWRGEPAPPGLARIVVTLLALELERTSAPERASDAAVADFVSALVGRTLVDRESIVARGRELAVDFTAGATAVLARARPHHPEQGDWRARVLTIAERGARGVARDSLSASVPVAALLAGDGAEGDQDVLTLVGDIDVERAQRVARAVVRELELGLVGYAVTVTTSRPAADPADLHRAAAEALLAANVAEARGERQLAFEQTGAYRLLLSAVTDDRDELRAFHEETVAPVVAYDEEYETDLLRTLEAYLDADGSVATTAQRLYTHRHTIRYRLERVRELSGLDVSSSDGRERLSLGLKAMRVLGIGRPAGPATEPGTEAGRVRRGRAQPS